MSMACASVHSENMFWDEYLQKRVSADEAVNVVESGDWVQYGEFVCIAPDCDAALARRKDELKDVKISAICLTLVPEPAKVDPKGEHFVINDWYFSGISRMLHDKGLCHHIAPLYHQIPIAHRKGEMPRYKAAFISVGPMDKNGYFNLGPSSSVTYMFREFCDNVIVEVNTSMPHCLGGAGESIHISEVDYIVESSKNPPLLQVPGQEEATEADVKIARLLMEELEDGCCLQFGIGALPNLVAKMIAESDLKDLGMHTEMLVDSCVDLYESGILTGKRKQIDKGKMVYTFAMGTNKLYEFIDNNPACAIYGCEYTNDPVVIAQNDKVFAVNNCLHIDLYGQVSAESIGPRHISGTGGSIDFMLGAFRSKGGKGFVCMNATATGRNGEIFSRIVPCFKPFTAITMPRTIPHYIATEYGIVNLKGKSTWEKAEALISIAHPDFRDELIAVAEQNNIWIRSNKIAV